MGRIVFLHGLIANRADPFVAAMSERFDVFAPVHPGFRDLADIEELHDVHDLALHLDDLLEGEGIDDAVVVGHSFGGMVAAELAAHVPKRVAKLVLIDALGLWEGDDPVADVFRAFPMELPDLLWTDPASPETHAFVAPITEGAEEPMVAVVSSMIPGMTTVGKYLWPIPDKGLSRRLRRISADTLILWGAKDRVASAAYADRFAAGIPKSTARVIDDAGHMLPYERTSEVVEEIATFTA